MRETERSATAGKPDAPKNSQPFEYKTAANIAASARAKLDWYNKLICGDDGTVLPLLSNVRLAIRNVPSLIDDYCGARIEYDRVFVFEWGEKDDLYVSRLMERLERYGIVAPRPILEAALRLGTDELKQKLTRELKQRRAA